ncbi:MAG: bifunctional diguanylate cyclase/phosphodiesterase [Oscillospiraceae bacterium]|nr:bifunctional diguanylate cyclase/phosphodiesterase [Oscillospiraceae bacterium]
MNIFTSSKNIHSYESSLLYNYDCKNEHLDCLINSYRFRGNMGGSSLYRIFVDNGFAHRDTAQKLEDILDMVCSSEVPKAIHTECLLTDSLGESRWFAASFSCAVPKTNVIITFTDINDGLTAAGKESDTDKLTGLCSKSIFCRRTEAAVADASKEYAVIYFDILRFKAINDIFGIEKGDALLKEIARVITDFNGESCFGCRIDSDRFVVFIDMTASMPEMFIDTLSKALADYDLPFEITFNAGIFLTDGEVLPAEAMIDRAILAQSAIKGRYTVKFRYFTESMRNEMLGEQEITGMMATALAEKHFIIYYQPQYDHLAGVLTGAEALVRWSHPERGIIAPGVFIPIFEKNGFITVLDFYVFEEVCAFLRRCIDRGFPVVPVSSNFSRYDIFQPDFVDQLERIRKKYNIPVEYLRIEITESSVLGGSQTVNEIISRLHSCGYIVEMDDFGSGYSSLNVLKDIDLDLIKLDMEFLSEDGTGKGETILSAVVKMAKKLNISVIAEGVESIEQADFLKDIGCNIIQGFYYSKPLPENNYTEHISSVSVAQTVPCG